MGKTKKEGIYTAFGHNSVEHDIAIAITGYIPDLDRWIDYKVRRR